MAVEITQQERESPLHEKLREHYTARLAELRSQNDEDLGEEKTAKLRGRIAETKAFIALFEDKPEFKRPKPIPREPR